MVPDPGPWIALAIGVCLVVVGLIVAALGIGGHGKRKALKEGRCCPMCGLWDDEPVEVLIHRINEHWVSERE